MDSEQEHLDLCERHTFEKFSSAMFEEEEHGFLKGMMLDIE